MERKLQSPLVSRLVQCATGPQPDPGSQGTEGVAFLSFSADFTKNGEWNSIGILQGSKSQPSLWPQAQDSPSLGPSSYLYTHPTGGHGNGMTWRPSPPASLPCTHGEVETQEVLSFIIPPESGRPFFFFHRWLYSLFKPNMITQRGD